MLQRTNVKLMLHLAAPGSIINKGLAHTAFLLRPQGVVDVVHDGLACFEVLDAFAAGLVYLAEGDAVGFGGE